MATKILMIKDVEKARSGDIVSVKPGYSRYLLAHGFAVRADKRALRMQERLKEERAKKALIDKQESEEVASRIQGITLTKVVKVDHEGHMYGSVTVAEIADLLLEHHQVELDKKSIQLKHAIKSTGVHEIHVKLKEGVNTSFHLKVMSEEGHRAAMAELPEA